MLLVEAKHTYTNMAGYSLLWKDKKKIRKKERRKKKK